jgi:hypothetical protein
MPGGRDALALLSKSRRVTLQLRGNPAEILRELDVGKLEHIATRQFSLDRCRPCRKDQQGTCHTTHT